MNRREEAHVSQSLISNNKIIYVEGNLDCKIIRDFLGNQEISNVRVTEVADVELSETALGAKNKVIAIIQKANRENIDSEYLGIVDQDYDYFDNNLKSISNLEYTDYNSIESYFVNLKLINKLLSDYNLTEIEEGSFQKWKSNSIILSSWFYFQLKKIEELNDDEKLSFQSLRLDSTHFVDFQLSKIRFNNIVSHKITCNNKSDLKRKYIDFVKAINRISIYQNLDLFLHGKHTFKFLVCLLRRKYQKLKSLSYENLECILKDKFLLFFSNKEDLFIKILRFAT